jgi:hypothetical protein
MKLFSILGFLAISATAFSQCEILNRVSPDGSMIYYMRPVVFYQTDAKGLKGNVVSDKENYFLGLQPSPVPEKSLVKKLKSDLEIKLSNGKVYTLGHFDTRFPENDSDMELLYLIDKKDMDDFLKYEVMQVRMDMKGTEGFRTYVFKLHKAAICAQLNCFLKNPAGKKKK